MFLCQKPPQVLNFENERFFAAELSYASSFLTVKNISCSLSLSKIQSVFKKI